MQTIAWRALGKNPTRIQRYSSQSTNKKAKRATTWRPRRPCQGRWPEHMLEIPVAEKPADICVRLAGQPASSFVIVVNGTKPSGRRAIGMLFKSRQAIGRKTVSQQRYRVYNEKKHRVNRPFASSGQVRCCVWNADGKRTLWNGWLSPLHCKWHDKRCDGHKRPSGAKKRHPPPQTRAPILDRVDETGGRRKWNICKDALVLCTNTAKNFSQIQNMQKYLSGSSSDGRVKPFIPFQWLMVGEFQRFPSLSGNEHRLQTKCDRDAQRTWFGHLGNHRDLFPVQVDESLDGQVVEKTAGHHGQVKEWQAHNARFPSDGHAADYLQSLLQDFAAIGGRSSAIKTWSIWSMAAGSRNGGCPDGWRNRPRSGKFQSSWWIATWQRRLITSHTTKSSKQTLAMGVPPVLIAAWIRVQEFRNDSEAGRYCDSGYSWHKISATRRSLRGGPIWSNSGHTSCEVLWHVPTQKMGTACGAEREVSTWRRFYAFRQLQCDFHVALKYRLRLHVLVCRKLDSNTYTMYTSARSAGPHAEKDERWFMYQDSLRKVQKHTWQDGQGYCATADHPHGDETYFASYFSWCSHVARITVRDPKRETSNLFLQ